MLLVTVSTSIGTASAAIFDDGQDVDIPTTYEAGHFYATPTLSNGNKLRLLLDTGGGSRPTNWMNAVQAKAVGLDSTDKCFFDGENFRLARPTYKGAGLPQFEGACEGILVFDYEGGTKWTGQLVPAYFVKGVWTFDYPGKRVILRKGHSKLTPTPGTHLAAIGLKEVEGETWGWPRIAIIVDSQQLDMLLDTGATSHLTAEGKRATHAETTSDGDGVASYIASTTFDAWKKQHPDWMVVENGDDLIKQHVMPIIRVPEVEIAGWKVGPIWFTRRPDNAFHNMMASLMDKRPEGAVGANIFESFRMTLDYPNQIARFECVRDCRSK